jgi:phospholipid transport system transporter-binding protein
MAAAVSAAGPAAAGGFVAQSPSHYRLELPLRFATVLEARARGLAILHAAGAGAGDITFDLQGVGEADSAGLALLVDWLASARAAGRTLRYAQVPGQLRALAKLSDVEPLLEKGLAAVTARSSAPAPDGRAS